MDVTTFGDSGGRSILAHHSGVGPSAPRPVASPLVAVRAYLAGRLESQGIARDATLATSGSIGELRGQAAIAGYWTAFASAVAERELAVETAIETGDRAVVVLRLQGIHRGRLLGHPPTGRRLDLPLVVVAQVDGGRIRHLRLCFDRLTLLEQIGAAASVGFPPQTNRHR